MNPIFPRSIRRWWRNRSIAKDRTNNPLREFIYLDEVSIYSLYSSRLGAIPQEYTDLASKVTQDERSTGFDAGPNYARLKFASRFNQTQTASAQVLRKSNVQALFKELVDHERDHVLLQPADRRMIPPEVSNTQQLLEFAKRDQSRRWSFLPRPSVRGQLIEINAELEASRVFEFSSVFSTIADLSQEIPELFDTPSTNLAQTSSISKMLERFLVGLIPLKCRSLDYVVLTLDSEQVLIHRTIADKVDPEGHLTSPLYITGVTESVHYWKDIRRVLFSRENVTILCRISQPDILASWNDIKLLDLLEKFMPLLGPLFRSGVMEAMESAAQSGDSAILGQESISKNLVAYADAIGQELGEPIEQHAPDLSNFLDSLPPVVASEENQRSQYKAIERYLESQLSNLPSRERMAEIREHLPATMTGEDDHRDCM